MNIIFNAFFFFLPAGIANMVPVIVAKIPGLKKWDAPLDFGKKFRGKRILGDHKTIRGFVSGIVAGCIVALVLYQSLLLGFLLSFGALAGDSIKSFFKRQMGIASGKSWFPFDQIDYIVGGLLLSVFVVRLSLISYSAIFLLYFFLHLLITMIGYFLKLKKTII